MTSASKMRIAAVQAGPVFLDRDATVDKTCTLIERAGERGIELLGFPEGFVPGHPGWVELLPPDVRAQELSKRLFKNSIEVPGPAIEAIAKACGRAEVGVVLGICERLPRTTGTLFNTQVFIDRRGKIAAKHQKFVPTVGERLVHGPGQTGTVNSFSQDGRTVAGLICGENSNPLAQYATAREYPVVHVAAWPQHFRADRAMSEVIELVSKGIAYSLKCFVLNSVTTITDEMLEAYGTEETLPFLRSESARARSSVVSPRGEIEWEADGFDEQLLEAEIDPDAVIVPKFVHDTAGHYNRPELFAHLFENRASGG